MESQNVSLETISSSNSQNPMNISNITEQSPQPFRTVQLQIPTTDGINKKKRTNSKKRKKKVS